MGGRIVGWVIVAVVLAFLAVSWLFAADSRDNEDWKPLAGGVGTAPHHLARPFSASPGAQAVGRAVSRLGARVAHPRRSPGRAGAHNHPVPSARS
jgi:hypothetical protein